MSSHQASSMENLDISGGQVTASQVAPSGFAAALECAARKPGRVLAAILGIHFLVWTMVPLLVCPNLQLDLVEGLALGKDRGTGGSHARRHPFL